MKPKSGLSGRTLTVCFWISFTLVLVNAYASCTAPNEELATTMAQTAGVFAALSFVFFALGHVEHDE